MENCCYSSCLTFLFGNCFKPTCRSCSQMDQRCSRRAALRAAQEGDGGIGGLEQGRATWQRSARGATRRLHSLISPPHHASPHTVFSHNTAAPPTTPTTPLHHS